MTESRDSWARSKQVTPELARNLATIAAASVQNIQAQVVQLGEANHAILGAQSFVDFYAAVEKAAEISRQITQLCHHLKLVCDFQVPPATTFTDYAISQNLLMPAFKRTWWLEGPCFCGLGIDPGARILDLGCGTGYYTDLFLAPFASEIVAIDIDPRAIETAQRFHQAKNIRYEVMDFRQALPPGPFDVIFWTPTIHAGYSIAAVDLLMTRLRSIMATNARVVGFTAVESQGPGEDVLWHDLDSLGARLKRYFANVRVFEREHFTIEPPRHNLYFYASDGPLPFDDDWPHSRRL